MKKLEENVNARINYCCSDKEIAFLEYLTERNAQFMTTGKFKMNRCMRILINFLKEREDIVEEFTVYAWNYLDINDLAEVKRLLEDQEIENSQELKRKFDRQFSELDGILTNLLKKSCKMKSSKNKKNH